MKIIPSVFLLALTLWYLPSFSQCPVTLADSSFENGTLAYGGTPDLIGRWYTDDGVFLESRNAFHGDTMACSNGGGAYQFFKVDSQSKSSICKAELFRTGKRILGQMSGEKIC